MASDIKLKTRPFDAADYLTEPEDQVELLEDALSLNDPIYIAVALGTVARARGMTDIAKAAGVTREALYRALSPKGDPRLSTLLGVVKALGFRLALVPITPESDATIDPD